MDSLPGSKRLEKRPSLGGVVALQRLAAELDAMIWNVGLAAPGIESVGVLPDLEVVDSSEVDGVGGDKLLETDSRQAAQAFPSVTIDVTSRQFGAE
jgi:hypothetical protein